MSVLSTRRRFGQLAPQLMVRLKPPSPRPAPASREGWGEDDTRIWARAGLVCPKGVVAVEPLREKRSQRSTVGSARGDLRAADSRLTWTADPIDLEPAAGDDTGEELRALFDPRFRGIGDTPYMGFCFVSHPTFSCGLASSSSRLTSESPIRSRQARRPTGVLRWLMGSVGTLDGRGDTASCWAGLLFSSTNACLAGSAAAGSGGGGQKLNALSFCLVASATRSRGLERAFDVVAGVVVVSVPATEGRPIPEWLFDLCQRWRVYDG